MNAILNGVVTAIEVFLILHQGFGPTSIAVTCGVASAISYVLGKTSK